MTDRIPAGYGDGGQNREGQGNADAVGTGTAEQSGDAVSAQTLKEQTLEEQVPEEWKSEWERFFPDWRRDSSPDWEDEWSRFFPDWREEQTVSDGFDASADEHLPFGPRTVEKKDAAGRERSVLIEELVSKDAEQDALLSSRRTVRRKAGKRRLRTGRKRRGVWIFLTCLAAAVLLAVGSRTWARLSPLRQSRQTDGETDQAAGISIPPYPSGQGGSFLVTGEHGERLTAGQVYQKVNPTVVTVLVGVNDVSATVGTGVIFSGDGYFITNYHVIEGGRECLALLEDGRRLPASYVGGDRNSDLAVLKMNPPAGGTLPAAVFGDSDLLNVGDDVYAIGNPLGMELRGTLTNGIVSAANRKVEVDGRIMTLIQTNAALNTGNSGGPLINEYGQVVGINVVKMSSHRSTVEGLGFAIPSASMERMINDFLSFGASQPLPSIGVMVDPEGVEVEDGLWGLRVVSVTEDSPAEKAGIQIDDYLLTADGTELRRSQNLLRVRNRRHIGDTMELVLWRDGERIETVVELTKAVEEA